MPITSDQDLERAVQEYQSLRNAPDGSREGERRQELDAEIQAYYQANAEDIRRAKPPR